MDPLLVTGTQLASLPGVKAFLAVVLSLLGLGVPMASGISRTIHLRAEAVVTPPKGSGPQAAALSTPSGPVTGLWLLQFTNHIEPAWREELRRQGVELVHYVPDDAFIARFDGVAIESVKQLSYVQWTGPFEARWKVHPRLAAQVEKQVNGRFDIHFLGRPGLSAVETLLLNRSAGARAGVSTSLGTIFEASVTAPQLRRLAASPDVIWIEPAPRPHLTDEIAVKIIGGDDGKGATPSLVQAAGFDGRDVTVAVADSGLDSGDLTALHPDLDGRVDALFFYDTLTDASDEHGHGTHVAGIVAGNAATGEVDDNGHWWGLGVAPGAHLVAQRIFDGAGGYHPPPSNARLTQDAVRAGAYVGSNSWGDDTAGEYNLNAAEFDGLVRDADPQVPGEQAYVLEFSAGNAGPGVQTLDSPAVGKNVLATGASENNRFGFGIYDSGQEVIADFSSRGPAEDGRIKPDLVAPGTWIASLRSVYANDNNSWAPIDDRYLYEGGTSQAGPHASGACAVAVQWYRATHAGATPSPALVKAMLMNSTDSLGTALVPDPSAAADPSSDGTGTILVGTDNTPIPNNDEGWGRLNLANLILSPVRWIFQDQGVELATGEAAERKVIIGGGAPLRILLAYTDVPGLPAAIPALVNDLDLELVAPDGTLYRGNAIAEGESVAGTPEGDRVNNVEGILIGAPSGGQWTVRVVAHHVPVDVHHRTNGLPRQDFALVISGQLPQAGEGIIAWDRTEYRLPSTATVRFTDQKLTNTPSLKVRVFSSTDTNGLVVTLKPSGFPGAFAGTVALADGPVVPGDGRLHAANLDQLVASLPSQGPTPDISAVATVDTVPPVIGSVSTTLQFGQASLEWQIDKPSTSVLYYGTTNAVTNAIPVPGFITDAAVDLPALTPGTTIFYEIVATDRAGNQSTNNNGGAYFRLIAPKAATALLLYTPESLFTAGGALADTPYPGPENWTGPLDVLGLPYEVWDTSVEGRAPTVDELRQYQLVLWRPEELTAPLPGLLSSVTGYVRQGGSLFVASFDILTRLQEAQATNFRQQVLHVADFQADQGANQLVSASGDPVGDGSNVTLNYDSFPSGLVIDLLGIVWPDGADALVPGTNTAPAFYQEDNLIVGIHYPRTGEISRDGRVVFLSCAFESIPDAGDAPNNRISILQDAIRFLVPTVASGATVALDQPAYTLPQNALVEVTDGSQTNASVTVTIVTPRQTSTLSLPATVRPGVFQGRWTLTGNPGTSGSSNGWVADGDVVRVSYTDLKGQTVETHAPIDTRPPAISNVAAEPDYNEANITWSTDKPTDATVRFGESGGDDSFLTRTTYQDELATNHSVLISGLLSDRLYYFQVLSRDAAGNQTRDDRSGSFYTVRTLKPLTPPWTDDLESGGDRWLVLDNSGGAGLGDLTGDPSASGSNWTLGTPQNSTGTGAHSGAIVWATNLGGNAVDFSASDLISPAIGLFGGNQATLEFWQNYEFSSNSSDGSDGFGDFSTETGTVSVSIDNGANWMDLTSMNDGASAGWEPVQLDLTPYIGNIIRIRFDYQLFSFNSNARLGWMLDDFQLTMNQVAKTAIEVTNNLAEAGVTLVGPTNQVATGQGFQVMTNVPPGTYQISWSPVPYYLTPPPQTRVLTTNNSPILIQGLYTFPDVNHNGISDLWESHHFGAIVPGSTGREDSDGDGMSDFAEWEAGTDPLDPKSVLRLEVPLVQSGRPVRFTWPTVVGRQYWLETSEDLKTWIPVSDKTIATGSSLSSSVSALDPRIPYFFRVQVRP